MTLLSSSSRRSAGSVGLLFVLLLLLGGAQDATAQMWLQTSRVVTPVDQGAVRVFLDSLVNEMEQRNLEVRRSPDQKTKMSISKLRDTLIDEEGIGISSANHVFIDYRFSISEGSNLKQEIAGVYFVFRPGPDQSDIPVLYLNARSGWVDKFLNNKGTNLRTNEAALIPFKRHLGFAQIARQEETQIVEIGRQTVREGFHERKEALIRKVERLTYESYV